jgi:starch synthase
VRVLHVASEVTPWSQTGGLAEVVGALPAALARREPGIQAAVLTPLYRMTRARIAERGARLEDIGVSVTVAFPAADLTARVLRLVGGPPGLDTLFLDLPSLYDRGGLYGDASGDFADNALRFAFLARAAIAAGPRVLGGPPDLYHGHDWQAGLVPVYLRRTGSPARSIMTVHNLAFQGVFDKQRLLDLGLDWSVFTLHKMEHYDQVSFLKGGLASADAVVTVSPSYAIEALTPRFGEGLSGFLEYDVRRLKGILNGIDQDAWDPARDPATAARFSATSLDGKATCRAALAAERRLDVRKDELLVGMVTRLTEQKGVDLVADLVPELYSLGVRLVVLGSGDRTLEERYLWLAERFRHHLSVTIGFDPALARRIVAGCDAVLMPSRFEPCGLTQLYAMRYGAVPVVNPVGGLRDSVTDPGDEGLAYGEGTGVWMEEASASGIRAALRRTAALYRANPPGWRRLVRTCMARDSSWDAPAGEYLALYREVLAANRVPA